MSHIFISYSRSNVEFVRYLKALLEAEGIRVWVDEEGLVSSNKWWRTIEEKISTCAGLLVVMSPEASDSDWVEREILFAESQGIPIFPILLSGKAWPRLANIQYENMTKGLNTKLSSRFVQSLRRLSYHKRTVEFAIVEENILEFEADIIVLKYAQAFYGVDSQIAHKIFELRDIDLQPAIGDFRYTATHGTVKTPHALFIGVPSLNFFNYEHISRMSRQALEIIATEAPTAKHIAMTIHGAGFGMDEGESVLAQFAGLVEGLHAYHLGTSLEKITVLELNARRIQRLRKHIEAELTETQYITSIPDRWGYRIELITSQTPTNTTPPTLQQKPYAFVLRQSAKDYDDIFYYGIQQPVHSTGLLCEWVDQNELNKEDVFEQTQHRINSAQVVVADITSPQPETLVSIGYAWGRGIPVLLIIKENQRPTFACQPLNYSTIRDLETTIKEQIQNLRLV